MKHPTMLAAMLLVSVNTVIAQEPVTLSLDRCIEIALEESPTVRVADLEVKRVDYSRKEIIGQLLPNVDFGAQYSRTIAKQTMYMNMDAFAGMGGGGETDPEGEVSTQADRKGDNGIKVGLDNSYSLGFQASMPIIAPQLWQTLSLSDQQIYRNVESARKSRLELVNQVKNAYYTLLLAYESQKVMQESYDMAELTYKTYSKQYSLGAASDYDVLRTSVAMKNIEPQLMQAEIAIKQARLQLLILMGVDSNFDFTVDDSLAKYQESMYEATLALDSDYSRNMDLKLLDIDTDMLRRNLKIQKLAYSPTLALTANYNWTSMNNGVPFKNLRWNPYSSVGIALSIPIFSGGQRLSKVRQVELQVEEMRFQRENLERSVDMQVKVAIDNIKMNVKQIASCAESVGQAERAHTIQEKSFDIGATSYLNLRDSELALTQARLAYNQAIYNYLVAHSNLELLLGNAPIEKYTSK